MKSIEISNFKNFRHLRIENLGSVNLIVGKNNTGKSTLLEAISILASGARIGWLKNILEIRGLNSQINTDSDVSDNLELETLCSLSHGFDPNRFMKDPIMIRSTRYDGEEISVEISLVDLISRVETSDNGLGWKRLVPMDALGIDVSMTEEEPILGVGISNNGNKTYYSIDQFFRRKKNLINGTAVNSYIPFEYVRTADFTGQKNPALFDKVALTPLEDILIKALRIIDPHITAINYLYEESKFRMSYPSSLEYRIPFVGYDNMPGKYRLSAMGDGINRILTIVLSMLNCKDGILLIDEFENGLHYSVQTDLWTLISRLSRQLNIQVFATTHSQDCIKSFLKATRSAEDTSEYGMARLIRLEKRKDDDIAVMYDESDELEYISTNDIETR